MIAGASAFPNDFREARDVLSHQELALAAPSHTAGNFSLLRDGRDYRLRRRLERQYRRGSRELGSERGSTVPGSGLTSPRMTAAGDYPHIALGVAVISVMVVGMNRAVWRPLYAFAERRTRLA